MAETLKAIARDGPGIFYGGALAERFAAHCTALPRPGCECPCESGSASVPFCGLPNFSPKKSPGFQVGRSASSGEVNYYDVIGPLGKKFHVIAPDIVGFGYTAPRGAQDYSGKAQGDHLVRFIEALDVGPVYLNGNSHGGYLVQYAALERPDMVRRLVITNSLNGTFPIPELPEGASYIYAPGGHQYPARTVEQTRASLARFYFHEDLVTEERVQLVHDIYMRNYGYADKRGRAVSYSVEASNTNLSYKGKHITEWAGELQMPLLLMWSEPGSKIEWGVAHFFRIPGAEMHLFPWSGHHLFADQRDRWLQVVTSWLNNEPARRPNVAR